MFARKQMQHEKAMDSRRMPMTTHDTAMMQSMEKLEVLSSNVIYVLPF